jgi:hypothetical protein
MIRVYCVIKEYDILSKYYTPDTDFFLMQWKLCHVFLHFSNSYFGNSHNLTIESMLCQLFMS